MKQRLEWVDYARGIGIILVVLAHNLGGQRNSGIPLPAPLEWVVAYAYSFHMPLFFFLSGLFVVHSYRKGFASFLGSKLRTILYPFVIWSVIEGVVAGSMGGYVNHPVSFSQNGASFLIRPIEQMWFLQALFVIFVLFALARRVGISPLLFFLASVGLVLFGMPWIQDVTISRICFHMVFFAAGAWLHSPANTRVLNAKAVPLLMVFLGALCVQLLLLFGYSSLPPFLRNNPTLPGLMMATAGIASVSAFSEVLNRTGRVGWLRVIGEYSMPIYLMHTIFGSGTRIVLARVLYVDDPTTHTILELAVGVGVPMLIAYGLNKCNAVWAFEWPAARRVKLAT